MEHRYSPRVHRDTKLFIYDRGTPVAIGRCKNSNRYGIFVETDHAVYLHQPLEIEMIQSRNRSESTAQRSTSKAQRMKCYVVHIGDNGFGVELHEENINLFGAIASTRNITATNTEIGAATNDGTISSDRIETLDAMYAVERMSAPVAQLARQF